MSGVLVVPPPLRTKTMKALELRAFDGVSLVFVSNKPIPTPAHGEVLVRVHAAPITAADVLFMQGRYGEPRPLPVVPGLECSGVVVQSGGGLLGRALLGRRVSCGPTERGDGTWAEYVCVPAWRCVPLRSFTSFEQGAPMLHSAISAFAMLEVARQRGAHAVAHTGGDSLLGRTLLMLAQRRKMQMLHLVASPREVTALRAAGARHVVDLGAGLSPMQLQALFSALGVNVVLEANAGEHTDSLLKALPRNGTLICHGVQPGAEGSAGGSAECQFDPLELIYGGKSIVGFSLMDWMRSAGFARSLQAGLQVQKAMAEEPPRSESSSQPGTKLPLDCYHHALDWLYRGGAPEGQIQFQPIRMN